MLFTSYFYDEIFQILFRIGTYFSFSVINFDRAYYLLFVDNMIESQFVHSVSCFISFVIILLILLWIGSEVAAEVKLIHLARPKAGDVTFLSTFTGKTNCGHHSQGPAKMQQRIDSNQGWNLNSKTEAEYQNLSVSFYKIIYFQLMQFSQQIQHHSPVAHCGLFVIDWTLLFTVFIDTI